MRREARGWLLHVGIVLLFFGVARTAWLCDDAYITFRTVENALGGHGPVWNVGERVQTYTHPLWFLLLLPARWLSGECTTTAMWLGIALSTAAAAWLARLPRAPLAGLAVLTVLAASRAWIDFATSGLETSLTALLLVALLAAAGTDAPARRLLRVALVTSALALTRLDLLALALPVLVHATRGVPWRRATTVALLGLLPLAAWLLFATVYYGTPLPVTASAKAFHHGIPTATLVERGLAYFVHNAVYDPVTATAIAGGIVAGLARRELRAPTFGVLLYNAYVVKVGGDYMYGRFLLPSLVVAVWLLGRACATARPLVPACTALAAVGLAFVPGVPDVVTPLAAIGTGPRAIPDHGLVSERDFYFGEHGLFSPRRTVVAPGIVSAVLRAGGHPGRVVATGGTIGTSAFVAGDLAHIVDPWLLDPSLMRLPLADPDLWRIGHYYRQVPEGYYETIATGENRIRDPGFARFHAAMWTVRTAPIWSAARWRAIWDVWRGAFDDGLAAFVAGDYRQPPRVVVPFAQLAGELPPGASAALPFPFWSDVPASVCVRRGGLEVTFDGERTAGTIRLHASQSEGYRLRFRRGGVTTGEGTVQQLVLPTDTLQPHDVAVPAGAAPFDALWIDVPVRPGPLAEAIARIELLP